MVVTEETQDPQSTQTTDPQFDSSQVDFDKPLMDELLDQADNAVDPAVSKAMGDPDPPTPPEESTEVTPPDTSADDAKTSALAAREAEIARREQESQLREADQLLQNKAGEYRAQNIAHYKSIGMSDEQAASIADRMTNQFVTHNQERITQELRHRQEISANTEKMTMATQLATEHGLEPSELMEFDDPKAMQIHAKAMGKVHARIAALENRQTTAAADTAKQNAPPQDFEAPGQGARVPGGDDLLKTFGSDWSVDNAQARATSEAIHKILNGNSAR